MPAFITASTETKTPIVRSSLLTAWAERLLLVFLAALFAVRAVAPAWTHLDADFANYYLAARLYRQGYPVERAYDWTWFQRQKDQSGIERPLVGFTTSPLTSFLPVLPLCSLPPLAASRWWLATNLGLALVIAAILKSMTDLPWRRIGVLMLLAIAPLHSDFSLGQIFLVTLFFLSLAAWLYFGKREFLSGVAVAVASATSIYAAFFLLFFLIKRQWRAAAGLVLGLAGILLGSIQLFGIAACRIYLREILPWTLRGEVIDPYATEWNSLNALLRRLFVFEPELNPWPAAHLPHLYAALYPLIVSFILVTFLWALSRWETDASRRKLEWSISCFLLLLLCPAPMPGLFVILIMSAVFVTDHLIARGNLRLAGAMVFVYTLACLPYGRFYHSIPKGWTSLLAFPRLFWLLVLAGMFLWILLSGAEGIIWRSRSFAGAALAFVAISATSVAFEETHLAGQSDNYRPRLTSTIGSAIGINPVATRDSVLYEGSVPRFGSTPDAYCVYRLHAGSITTFGGGGDWFHPAATADGNEAWAEVASAGQSRIVGFDSSEASPDVTTTVATDAEGPVVSAGGQWLAYIREVRGRGSLWIHYLRGEEDNRISPSDRQLAGPEHDVREATFSPEGNVLFSSSQKDGSRLYSVDPQTGRISEFASAHCSARYPAFSPNGESLAFSCDRGGYWQLVTMKRQNGEQRQLTGGDCNSITPAWTPDSRSLIYATDCGRGVGNTALAKIDVEP